MRSLVPLLVVACLTPAAPGADPRAQALSGTEIVRVSPRTAEAGQQMTATAPWVVEIHVPAGVVIEGLGLPPEVGTNDPLPHGYDTEADRSVLQLELPVLNSGETDEDDALVGGVGTFDTPKLCKVGEACGFDADEDGRWRAFRRRTVQGQPPVVTELQVAGVAKTSGFQRRIIAVWMDELDRPLDEADAIQFQYVGNVPRRATQITDAGYRVRVRWRLPSPDTDSPVCPYMDRSCWEAVPAEEVQPLEIGAGSPFIVQVQAPFDAVVNDDVAIEAVVLDAFGNPVEVDGSIPLQADGVRVGDLEFSGTMRGKALVRFSTAGMVRLQPVERSLGLSSQVGQWLSVVPAGQLRRRRLVGDTHMHTGSGVANMGFLPTNWGDHRGQFTTAPDALRYAKEVAGLDFAAASEHAARFVGWVPPNDPLFQPGGLCHQGLPVEAVPDWWTPLQEMSAAEEEPGFTTFPAYEWHGHLEDDRIGWNIPAHRIILYRDHDPQRALPIYTSETRNRWPQCLIRALDLQGRRPEDTLVVPHLMSLSRKNKDWDASYTTTELGATIATREETESFQRIGEIFSARVFNHHSLDQPYGIQTLTSFEGNWASDADADAWTFRHAWRDTMATMGVIGSSDSHSAMPGVNDYRVGPRHYHANEPGGYAFVVTDTSLPRRDGLFQGMYDRHTYATTGVRVWFDFTATDGVVSGVMGDELSMVNCEARIDTEVYAAAPVRSLQIWRTRLGKAGSWQLAASLEPDTEVATLRVVGAAPTEAARDMYYVRAFFGQAEAPQLFEDALWSSPIWIDWPEGCGRP